MGTEDICRGPPLQRGKDCHRSDDRLLSQGGRDIGPRQVGAVLERIRKEVKFYITFEVNNISKEDTYKLKEVIQ